MEWSGGKLPIIPGHEVAGQVVEVGDGAKMVVIYGGGGDPRELIQRGADEVVLLRGAHPRDYLAHADAVARLIAERRPWAVLAPATSYGRDLMARVAARLGLGLTADCVDLRREGARLLQFKPAFGGAVISVIASKTYPQMATVRPGAFEPYAPNGKRVGEVAEISVAPRLKVKESRRIEFDLPDPLKSKVVVGVGMGLKSRENVGYAIALAKRLGGAVAATRNVVQAGWLPYYVQVGASGKIISPAVYLAFGVRGDINHLVGIRRAKRVIAVNISRHADIFKVADLGVVGDATKILPPLLDKINKLNLP